MTIPLPSIAKMAELLGGDVRGAEVHCPGPGHSAADRSLSVKPDLADREGFVTHSFAGDDWKACRDHVREKLGLPEPKPQQTSAGKWNVLGEYIYYDQNGEPFLKVRKCRDGTGKKQYPAVSLGRQRLGQGQAQWPEDPLSTAATRSPLRPRSMCYFCEGEKDADNLAKMAFVATTASEGAAAKWDPGLTPFFKDRHVVILPDADRPGRAHAQKVAKAIHSVAASVRILDLYSRPARRIRRLGLHRKRYRRRQVGEGGEGGAAVGAERNRDKRRRGGRWRRTALGCIRVSRALRCLSFSSRACRTYAMERPRPFDGGLGQHAADRLSQPRAGIRQDTRVRGLRDSWCRIQWRR